MEKFITPTRILAAALAFLLISVIIDLSTALNVATDSPAQIFAELRGWNIFSLKVIGGLAREFGFALAIAWMISMAIERVAREQESKNLAETRQTIATDVFKAVIGSFVPADIRDLALETILLAPVTRPNMKMNFTFRPLAAQAVEERRYLLLEVASEYTVKNESTKEVDFNVNMFIPKCPASAHNALHRVHTVAIGQVGLGQSEIEAGAKAIADTEGEIRYSWPRKIPPQSDLNVMTRWSAVKDMSDTEVWSSLIPSSRYEITIDMQVPNLEWGVDPLHHGQLRPIGPRVDLGINNYTSTRPLLPFQGVSVWWRPREAVAAAAVPPSASNG